MMAIERKVEKGSDCHLTETPWSIQIQDIREIHIPILVSICSNLPQQQQSPHNTPPSRSAASVNTMRSIETSVENVPYQRLNNETITSIPKQPTLQVF